MDVRSPVDEEVEPLLPVAPSPGSALPWRQRLRRTGWRAWDRVRELATDPRVWICVGTVAILLAGSFVYFWAKASRLIDARLAGGRADVHSGIYAAPLVLRPGQPLAREDLVSYLEALGYGSQSEGHAEEGLPGRYLVEGDAFIVEPLEAGVVATGRYTPVAIHFAGERGIARIVDVRTNAEIEECAVEPLAIASAYNEREKRVVVEYDAIPAVLRKAIITTEDRRFWSHNGVDYRGIARAVRENWGEGDAAQGGSTITQQLVKNVFLTPERTYTRKVKEAWISYVLEWKLTKEQIFALYCNEIFLGQRGRYAIHGFAEAARHYFGKDLSALTIEESALLAGIVHAPSANSPYRFPDRAKARRDLVLDMMVETASISAEEAETAKAAPVVLQPLAVESSWLEAPYFNDYVQTYLEEVFEGPLSPPDRYAVETTIDINLQHAAGKAVANQLEKLDAIFAQGKRAIPPGTVEVALVAIEPKTGAVVAMVGGRNYTKSQFNRVTDAVRQPGSVFKPFVYATALAGKRFTAATTLLDAPQTFTYAGGQTYEPDNYGQSYANAEIPLRVAFRNSKNVPTVELAMKTGLERIATTAERAGLPRPELYPSMALGVAEVTPLEIAQAYTAFVNGGDAVEPTPVAATRGDIVLPRAQPRTVFTPQVAYVMTNLMEDVVVRGTGRGVRASGITGAIAGKTGTSRDGWFVGYTPNLVCVVWVGFDDNSQLGMTGADAALPVWAEFMKEALAFRPELGGERFERPGGISTATVCSESGAGSGSYCPVTQEEIFLVGTEPPYTCNVHVAELEVAPLVDEYGNPIDPAAASEAGADPVDTGATTPEEEADRELDRYAPPYRPEPSSDGGDAANRRRPNSGVRPRGTAGGARAAPGKPPPTTNRAPPKAGAIQLPAAEEEEPPPEPPPEPPRQFGSSPEPDDRL
jgi:penicillin-binding protein 1B